MPGIRCDFCRGHYAVVGVRSSSTIICLFCWEDLVEDDETFIEDPVVNLEVDPEWDGEDHGGDHFECPPSDEESGDEPPLHTVDMDTAGAATQIGGSSSSDQPMLVTQASHIQGCEPDEEPDGPLAFEPDEEPEPLGALYANSDMYVWGDGFAAGYQEGFDEAVAEAEVGAAAAGAEAETEVDEGETEVQPHPKRSRRDEH